MRLIFEQKYSWQHYCLFLCNACSVAPCESTSIVNINVKVIYKTVSQISYNNFQGIIVHKSHKKPIRTIWEIGPMML